MLNINFHFFQNLPVVMDEQTLKIQKSQYQSLSLCLNLTSDAKNVDGKNIFLPSTFLFDSSSRILLNQTFITQKKNLISICNQVNNLIIGTKNLYFCRLDLSGAGYRSAPDLTARLLRIDLGYGHFIILTLPRELHMYYFRQQLIFLSSNQMCLRTFMKHVQTKFRTPNAYKQKGFSVVGATIKFKAVKRQ
jgi:ribosomal protein L6P/L9E